ncbi:MAG: hypothetical protein RL263_1198, partial [Bacteroidota bacterium]
LPPQYADGILAVVGEKIVMFSDFETEKVQLARGQVLPDSQQLFCYLLEQLVVRKLMLSQAEIDSLPLDEDRVEAEIDNRIRNFQRQAGTLADLERYLGKSILEFKDEIRPKMREQMLAQEMQSKIVGNLKISPKEVQQYYDRIPEDSLPVINTEVEVAQLLVELPISSVAEEFAQQQLEGLRRRILKGESFEKLARAYSMDPGSKANGGMLPEFGRGEMVGEFERVAFKLKPDSISQVFKSDFGYHVMKLIKRQGERILAAHILIRPENTSDDYLKASNTADTLYKKLLEGSIDWCDAVKKNSSEDFGNRGYCGFITDENTGMQKRLFETLPSDIKLVVDKLKPGEFSKPAVMAMPDGRTMYRIIYLKSFVAPHKANLVQDYSRIQMEAEAEKRQQIIDKWVDGTRKKTYIRINTRNLDCGKISRWNNE